MTEQQPDYSESTGLTNDSEKITRPNRTVITAIEHRPIDVPLDLIYRAGRLDIYPEVTGKNYFQIKLDRDKLVFQAGGYVGLIPINDRIAIDVRPRVPIKNLERILRVVDHTPITLHPHTRIYASSEENIPSLLDFFSQSLIDFTAVIEQNGLFREYQQRRDTTSFPRGRILLTDTLQKQVVRGEQHRVTISWYDRTIDNPVNRCLKYAIWYLAQKYSSQQRRGVREIIASLNRAYALLQGVSLDKTRAFLNDKLVQNPRLLPSIRQYYVQPLYLATTIIRERGVRFSDSGDDVVLASFLINLERIFEDYVREVLSLHIPRRRPRYSVLDGNKSGSQGAEKPLFDPGYPEDFAKQNKANPDIVVRYTDLDEHTGQNRLVVDTKYKLVPLTPDRDDLNQVLAYALSYRAPYAMIIHPSDRFQTELKSLGRIDNIRIFLCSIDLSASLDETETQLTDAVLQVLDSQ